MVFPYKNVIQAVCLMAATLVLISCEQKLVSREYGETVIVSPLTQMADSHGHSHEFMASTGDDPHQQMALPGMSSGQEMQDMLDASVARPALSWDVPDGWRQEEGSGMRLATFRGKGIECSIVSLGGLAGGVQPNVARWIRQINVPALPDSKLGQFLSSQENIQAKGKFSVNIIDLTELTSSDQLPSMIAAIAQLPEMTVFVKMTGNKQAVIKNRAHFKALCQSLNL